MGSGTTLLRLMLGAWADEEIGPVLRSVLQTAAHEPSTREKLRRVVEASLMGVSQLGADERDRAVRSGLVASQIMGLAMMRYIWKIEPVASMTDDEVVPEYRGVAGRTDARVRHAPGVSCVNAFCGAPIRDV